MVDGNPETWWSTGPGDLALNPVDVDALFPNPCVVDTLIVVTSTLKGQLRLRDFDLFAGLDGAWDGAHPVARVRNNAEVKRQVRFPAVRADRLRIRMLGTRRSERSRCCASRLTIDNRRLTIINRQSSI